MKRVQLEILLGTILVFLSVGILIYLGLDEPERLTQYEAQQQAREIEFGASVFEANCTRCHGEQAQGTGIAPCLRCEELFTTRLEEVGWEGSLEDYIISVVATGRQVSTRPELYPGEGKPAMPTWSEKFGGPLRDDQIRAVSTFIMNYEPYALGLLPTPQGVVIEGVDPGKVVFSNAGCTACHTISGFSQGVVGPALDGIGTRAGTVIDGYSAEEYIRESILDPNAYIVEEFDADVMPQNFSDILDDQALDDLVNYLLTLTEEE